MSIFHKSFALLAAGVIAASVASSAQAAASGRNWERAALQWQAAGQFDSAANGFLKAADAFAAEGAADARVRALREAAAANEQYANQLIAGGAKAAKPVRQAAAPAQVAQVAPAAPAGGGGTMPAGHYVCLFAYGGSPGSVDIRGATYRGPSLEPSGGFAPYSMAGKGVTWSHGFGEFKVVSTEYRGVSNDSAHSPWFRVTYSRTRTGGVDAVDCERE
jgi:hypothetical protein